MESDRSRSFGQCASGGNMSRLTTSSCQLGKLVSGRYRQVGTSREGQHHDTGSEESFVGFVFQITSRSIEKRIG